MVLTVKIKGAEEVQELLKKIPVNSYEVAREAFNQAALDVHKKVSSYSGGLFNRTGRLKRSLKPEVHGTKLSNLGSSVSTKIIYAPLQEKGGTINAKDKYLKVPGGPYLNIPLSANKTAAGVMRQNARTVFQMGGFIIKSKKGNYLVMSKEGLPMFVLLKQVTVPARLGMVKAAEDEVPTLLSNINKKLLEDV